MRYEPDGQTREARGGPHRLAHRFCFPFWKVGAPRPGRKDFLVDAGPSSCGEGRWHAGTHGGFRLCDLPTCVCDTLVTEMAKDY